MATSTDKQKIAPAAPSLPQYPEMIMAAIEAMNDKDGSNKTSISKHIEATYGSLPAAHTTLLSHHLNKMKASGQLILVKNNYLKPDPNSAPRRGRGRPPKPKGPLPTVIEAASPRPRGRPPKVKDGAASSAAEAAPEKAAAVPTVIGKKRGRGRPPKVAKTESVSEAQGEEEEDEN